ncbi:MAG TPA: hypothetical protein VN611_12585 [Patescibacteria group bacterium]|nr:hypothetical protein [Patescibacteria group bacterium]
MISSVPTLQGENQELLLLLTNEIGDLLARGDSVGQALETALSRHPVSITVQHLLPPLIQIAASHGYHRIPPRRELRNLVRATGGEATIPLPGWSDLWWFFLLIKKHALGVFLFLCSLAAACYTGWTLGAK